MLRMPFERSLDQRDRGVTFAVIREQAGTFSDSIRLWSEA